MSVLPESFNLQRQYDQRKRSLINPPSYPRNLLPVHIIGGYSASPQFHHLELSVTPPRLHTSTTTMLPPRSAVRALSSLPRPSCRSPSCLTPPAMIRSIHSTHFISRFAIRQSVWLGFGWALGGLSKRPVVDMMRSTTLEQSRGMKVRSSVKKLCDGCKVRP